MLEVIELRRDQTCGACTVLERQQRQANRSEPIRYLRVFVFNDPQYRPSLALCEDCARAMVNGLNLMLGEHT